MKIIPNGMLLIRYVAAQVSFGHNGVVFGQAGQDGTTSLE